MFDGGVARTCAQHFCSFGTWRAPVFLHMDEKAPTSRYFINGPGRSRTSARGFEVPRKRLLLRIFVAVTCCEVLSVLSDLGISGHGLGHRFSPVRTTDLTPKWQWTHRCSLLLARTAMRGFLVASTSAASA
jgi:hypothetical protein